MISLATGETNDIIAQARGEEARWNEELVVAKKLDEKSSGSDGSKVDSKSKKSADRITEERRKTAQRHLAQLGVVTFGNEDRFSQAVKEGLFSEEEATERRREHRGNTLRTTLDALIKDGLTDSAESILDELEGNGSVLAVECGIDARQMSAFRNNVNLMRQRKQAEVERAQAEAREIARTNAIEKEIKFLQAPIPVNAEAQAAHLKRLGTEYAALADDPTLDASTRLAYIKTARSLGYQSMELKEGIRAKEEREKIRSANAKVDAIKAERDFNEESLAASLNQLRVMELDGTIDQTQANAAQAAIWRKFATLTYEKKISPTFMHSFQGRIMSRLSAQEQNAMRKFYRAFGYVGDITDGSIAAKDRKASESEDFYAPYVEEDKVVRGNANAISGKQLFEYGEALLRTLRTLDPGMNREGVIDAEIQRLKTHWQKGKFDENRDASVRAILEMQRETKMLSIIDSNSKKTNQNEKKQDEK
jgi:hypothetical protein